MTSVLLLVCLSATAVDPHEELNPVYKEHRAGAVVGPKTKAPLPPPVVPDGLDVKEQQKALANLPGLRVPLDEFTRNAIGASYILTIGDLKTSEEGIRYRTIEVTFIAYGDLAELAKRQEKADFTFADKTKATLLTEADLAKRNIRLEGPAAKDTRFGHGVFALLDRVQLSVTSQATSSKTAESIVLASKADPRFARDTEFPNQWQDLELKSDGTRKLGPPMPYGVTASYVKCTQLKEPKGAILIEYHSIFEQPEGWFGGNDLLRSKLPIAVQRAVRSYREDLRKANP